jgi:hypothetical protein
MTTPKPGCCVKQVLRFIDPRPSATCICTASLPLGRCPDLSRSIPSYPIRHKDTPGKGCQSPDPLNARQNASSHVLQTPVPKNQHPIPTLAASARWALSICAVCPCGLHLDIRPTSHTPVLIHPNVPTAAPNTIAVRMPAPALSAIVGGVVWPSNLSDWLPAVKSPLLVPPVSLV